MAARSATLACLAAVLGSSALAGCQAYMPRDETPVRPPAFAVDVPRGPSSQRLGPDGFPLLGAFPSAAAQQADPATVSQTQARYANAPARAAPDPAGYQRSVNELRQLAEAQRSRSQNR